MDTGRLATMLPAFILELERMMTPIQLLRLRLKGDVERGQVPELRQQVDMELDRAPSLRFVPSWIRMIRALGGRKLHAFEVRRRLRTILDDSDYAEDRQGVLVEQVEGEIRALMNNCRNLLSALTVVGIEGESLPAAVSEIGVLYPSGLFADLNDFSREVSVLDRHLRTVAEIGGQGAAPKLAKLQTNGFDVFVLSELITGAKFAAVIFGVLRAWREVEELRKLRAETRRLSAEASEILERVERDRHIAAKEAIVNELTSGAAVADEARANELQNAARHVVEYVEQRIAMSVTFEVRSARPPEAFADAAVPENAQETQAYEQIREQGHVMSLLEIETPVALLAERSEQTREA